MNRLQFYELQLGDPDPNPTCHDHRHQHSPRSSPLFPGPMSLLGTRTKLGGNRNANPRTLGTSPTALGTTATTLGVPYPLLMVEGQGARPRASGSREQAWVCSAGAHL